MRRTAKEYWDANKASYPFHAIAQTGSPKPTHPVVKGRMFLCCPLGNGNSMWGFESEADRDMFVSYFQHAERA